MKIEDIKDPKFIKKLNIDRVIYIPEMPTCINFNRLFIFAFFISLPFTKY